MNVDNKKAAAACELEGEMYSMLRDLKLAKVMSNELVDGFFEEEHMECTSKNIAKLMCKYEDAWTRVNVLHDYICQVTIKVNELLKLAEEGDLCANPGPSRKTGRKT